MLIGIIAGGRRTGSIERLDAGALFARAGPTPGMPFPVPDLT